MLEGIYLKQAAIGAAQGQRRKKKGQHEMESSTAWETLNGV